MYRPTSTSTPPWLSENFVERHMKPKRPRVRDKEADRTIGSATSDTPLDFEEFFEEGEERTAERKGKWAE